jgi:excisionase family DNA binding protein
MLYAKKDAAHQISLSDRAIDYLIEKGRLKVRRIGGRVLIPHEELLRFSRHDRNDLIAPKVRNKTINATLVYRRGRLPE